jgi:Tfp pilus assembly protein PilV
MKARTCANFRNHQHGSSLVESVIAIAVLAVAVPLAMSAVSQAERSGSSSETHARGVWLVPLCLEELRAAREGRSAFFPHTRSGTPFPEDGDVWALAFTSDGSLAGKVTRTQYERGLSEVDGIPVRYLASLSAKAESASPEPTPMQRLRISVEQPAKAPAARRSKTDFHSKLP